MHLNYCIFYYTYTDAENSLSLFPPLFAGMTARTISATLFNPLELIRTKMQSEKLSYFGKQDRFNFFFYKIKTKKKLF